MAQVVEAAPVGASDIRDEAAASDAGGIERPRAKGARRGPKRRSPLLLPPLTLALCGAAPIEPSILTSDVTRFYQVYDANGGHPTAEQIQREYLDVGSAGLHDLARDRAVTGASIAAAIARNPAAYERARSCMAVLPRVTARLRLTLTRLGRLYPEARFPPITMVVSRTKPVGMTNAGGVRISIEALCATEYMNPNLEERFVHVVAHEYAHIQQDTPIMEKPSPTVLEASLIEGGAEFVAELISGQVGNLAPAREARGREREIATRFLAEADSHDLSNWLFNGTNERPGDLGYWVGYEIVKSYYERARDKRRALRRILTVANAREFLTASGWEGWAKPRLRELRRARRGQDTPRI